MIAEGLGEKPDFFLPEFDTNCLSVLRVKHYLPRDHPDAKTDSTKLNKD